MTTFQKNLIDWLKEAKADIEADGFIPTVDMLIERAVDQVEAEVDNEPTDFTGSNDAFGADR